MANETRQLQGRAMLANVKKSSTGFFVHETVTNLIYADATIAEAYELPGREALRGLPLRIYMSKVHPEDIPTLRETILGQQNEGVFRYSHRIVRTDGSVVLTRTSGFDFHQNGQPQRRVGMIEIDVVDDLTPMEMFVDQCLLTYQLAIEAGQPMVQYYLGLALMEIGFDLARSLRTEAEE